MLNKNPSINCSGCFACVSACPKQCIAMIPSEEGFLIPRIETENCIGCDLCQKVCPSLNPPKTEKQEVNAFAMVNLNQEQQMASSSGGIFVLLAQSIIADCGFWGKFFRRF